MFPGLSQHWSLSCVYLKHPSVLTKLQPTTVSRWANQESQSTQHPEGIGGSGVRLSDFRFSTAPEKNHEMVMFFFPIGKVTKTWINGLGDEDFLLKWVPFVVLGYVTFWFCGGVRQEIDLVIGVGTSKKLWIDAFSDSAQWATLDFSDSPWMIEVKHLSTARVWIL